jgi:hypothetical protein
VNEPSRFPGILLVVLLIAGVAFCLGITWGLPSRAVDPFLFGDRPAWSGEKIARLAPAEAARAGADVDANPILVRDRPFLLNATDEQRAELIQRYRLFSHQPDEMITFKSLSSIRQHRGDPRLYQYGGLWIYPVGAMLKASSMVGLVKLRSDRPYYLDRPEAFGRFYVVARFYTALWGLAGVWATFWIVRRLTGSLLLAATGALAFAFMPVVLNMAHEAKPHLPGLSLTLLAVVAAAKYVETGRARWGLLAGLLCGGALAMVISGLLAFAIVPMMVMLRPAPARERLMMLVKAGALGLIAYAALNPFVVINAIWDREMLRSNMGNSTAMYRIGVGGLRNAAALVVEGASPIVTIGGGVGLVVLAYAALRRRAAGCDDDGCPGRGDVGWLLAAPAALVAIQFVLLAANKPPEYARFALLPDAFLLVAAFAAIGRLRCGRPRAALAVALTLLTLASGLPYLAAFVRDTRPENSRIVAARHLKTLIDGGATTVAVFAEPAPYCMPPIDLFRSRLVLVPPGQAAPAGAIVVRVEPQLSAAPISWADARFTVSLPR